MMMNPVLSNPSSIWCLHWFVDVVSLRFFFSHEVDTLCLEVQHPSREMEKVCRMGSGIATVTADEVVELIRRSDTVGLSDAKPPEGGNTW